MVIPRYTLVSFFFFFLFRVVDNNLYRVDFN